MLNFLLETFLLGLRNLRLHKLRSTLTALGIIIGVVAFVMMVAIGEGAKRKAIEQMSRLGARNIIVRSVPPPLSTDAASKTQSTLAYGLSGDDLNRLRILRDHGLEKIVPLRNTEQFVQRGDTRLGTDNAIATTPQFFEVISMRLERGRYFTDLDNDEENPQPVCVIGAMAAQQLFPFEDPLGQTITVGNTQNGIMALTIIGVLEQTGLRPGDKIIQREIDLDVYFPLRLSERLYKSNVLKRKPGSFERKSIELSEIWLQADAMEHVEMLAGIATNQVKENHGNKQDVEVKAPIEILRSAEEQQRTFNFVLGGISLFALLVGGIGIMNIMLASVTERTREIGIRRALGAKRKHIILQFLIETKVISLAGAMAGIIFSVSAAMIWSLFPVSAQYPASIAPWSVAASVAFSALVGIGFGLYPAMTAASMDPIEALRHE